MRRIPQQPHRGACSLVRTACESAARRRLKTRLPAAQRRLGSAEDALETAKKNAKPPENTVRKLEAELAEAQRRLALCEDATADEDMTARIHARSLRFAMAEEVEELTGRLARIRDMAAPHIAERARAESERDAARRDLAELTQAMSDPFGSPLGRQTPEFERFIKYSGSWEDYPHTDAARTVLVSGLKFCGLYDVIVRETVDAWLNGDPAVRQASGILQDDGQVRVMRGPDGQIITLDVRNRQRFVGQHAEPAQLAPDARAALIETFGVGVVPQENDVNPALIGRPR